MSQIDAQNFLLFISVDEKPLVMDTMVRIIIFPLQEELGAHISLWRPQLFPMS